ncbi:MAG TPA: spore germination protein GerW family protein [Bryobacteraceae bacterium]|nr:spore germination protein GerW family protein [Bryobacteraceae bacterium]
MEIQELLHSLVHQAGAKTVFAEPVSADGRTVVPVAKVRCGFGGGSGKRDGQQQGGGGGGGFVARPVGFIEISGAGARWVPIVDLPSLAVAAAIGVFLGLLWSRR